MLNFSSNNVIVAGNISSAPHFQVHTSFLVMKSNGPKEAYVTISLGTVGEILDSPVKLNNPGFVKIRVNGEMFYTFVRDLQDNAFIESLAEPDTHRQEHLGTEPMP